MHWSIYWYLHYFSTFNTFAKIHDGQSSRALSRGGQTFRTKGCIAKNFEAEGRTDR